MILINLLPHRELARKQQRVIFNQSLGLAALLGGLVAALVFAAFGAQISAQQGKNKLLQRHCARASMRLKTCRPTVTCRCFC